MVMGLFCYLFHYLITLNATMAWHPAEADTSVQSSAVIQEFFGQLVASRLTILEMAFDDRCCPHSLMNCWSGSIDIFMWSNSIAIFTEFGLSSFTFDHTFAQSVNEVVSLGIVFICYRRKDWCPQWARPILHRYLQRPWLPLPWD